MGDRCKMLAFLSDYRRDIISIFKAATPSEYGNWHYYDPINTFYSNDRCIQICDLYKKMKETICGSMDKKRNLNIPLSYFIWVMEFVCYGILYSYGSELETGKHREKTATALLQIIKRNYETKPFHMDNIITSLTCIKFGSKALRVDRKFFKRLIMSWKRCLMQNLCYISYKYSKCDDIPRQISCDNRIVTTFMFAKFKNYVINQTDKTKLLKLLNRLPQIFGDKCIKDTFRRMTRECLMLTLIFISALDNQIKKKFIPLYDSHGPTNNLCTCTAKCTRFFTEYHDSGLFNNCEVRLKRECLLHVQYTWSVCQLCFETPSLMNRKLIRCRRGISPFSDVVSCTICGNNSFKDVNMYLCNVTTDKSFYYRHLAYTSNIPSYENLRKSNKAHFRVGSMCFGTRNCFRPVGFLDRVPEKCDKCQRVSTKQESCFDLAMASMSSDEEFERATFVKIVREMCSGCKIFAFCPVHKSSKVTHKIIQNILMS